jgi:hypothetical protein
MFRPGTIYPGCPIGELQDPDLERQAIEARDELVLTDRSLRGPQIDPDTPVDALFAAIECWASMEEGLCVFAGAVVCKKVE